ncbi:MAG: S8 family serine peptidase, partial [Actinomycetota bacterium]|nr:S8 family serine peptidase [Actinomycetota bacterium]
MRPRTLSAGDAPARWLLVVAIGMVMVAQPLGATAAGAAPQKPAGPPPAAKEKGPTERDPATVVVRFGQDVSEPAGRKALADRGLRVKRAVEGTGHLVVSTEGRSPEEVVRQLSADRRVSSVELNHKVKAAVQPNDPIYPQQPYLTSLGMPSAWDRTRGSASVRIAVVDTGVDLAHPDLVGHLDTALGYDYVNGDPVAQDDAGHGTMVAGMAAASTNNSIGVAGTGWDSRIIPIKVLDASGSGTDADTASGIVWAADQGAQVINVSLGGEHSSSVLREAVRHAIDDHGAVVVAAAGNESSAAPFYPAAYPGVVS